MASEREERAEAEQQDQDQNKNENVEEEEEEQEQEQEHPRRMNRMQQWLTHVSNQRTSLALSLFLLLIHLGLVTQRIYQYRQSSLAVIIARASGQCLNFDCFLVLMMTLRRSITRLRTAGFDAVLPLDRHVHFHKLIGWIICFFSFVHSVAHMANIGFLSIEKGVLMTDYLATGAAVPEGCVHVLQALPREPVPEPGHREDRGRCRKEGHRVLPWQALRVRVQGQEAARRFQHSRDLGPCCSSPWQRWCCALPLPEPLAAEGSRWSDPHHDVPVSCVNWRSDFSHDWRE